MSEHVYPRASLFADGARGAAGAALLGLPLLFAEPLPWIGVCLGLGFVSVVALSAITLRRRLGTLTVDGDGIACAGRRIAWADVQAVRLAYYTTRRDGEGGWFHLSVRGGGQRIAFDSALVGFEAVAARVAEAAVAEGATFDAATRANFAALAIPLALP